MTAFDVNVTQQDQLEKILNFLGAFPNVAVSVQIHYHLRSERREVPVSEEQEPVRQRRRTTPADVVRAGLPYHEENHS
jgi:hypothetical protein